jgi:UDP-glucose 4-epimerase
MKIFVTGGAGYIGSVVVEQLIASGESVVVFDNLSLGHRAVVHPDAVFVAGDLADRAAINAVLSEYRPDAVMHFASKMLVGEPMTKPFLYLGDRVTTGLNLFQSVVEHGVKRINLSSTASLFDQPESKFILERMRYWLDRIHGVRFARMRYFNAAGATATRGEDHAPELHLNPLVLQVAMQKRKTISIFGDDYPTLDGACVRDYIHVIDLAQAHILALGAVENGSRYYNLGNGEGFSVKQVIDTAREIIGIGT